MTEYERPLTATINNSPSKTEKSHRKECNINTIMARARRGIPTSIRTNGLFGDFTNVESYHYALNKVADAKSDFENLPSALRKRFDQDPAKLIEFLASEDNRQEAIELGLIEDPLIPEQPAVEPEQDPENLK